MEQQPKTEDLRLDPEVTIKELQQFFSSRDVPFGDPGCLPGFSRRLTEDPAFHEEMTSMARFVLYSVQGGGPRTELLHILIEAVGGPSAAGELEHSREPLQILLSFVREVTRSQRTLVPSEMGLEPTAQQSAQSVAKQPMTGFAKAEQPVLEKLPEIDPACTAEAKLTQAVGAGPAQPAIVSQPVPPSENVPMARESTSLQDASGRVSAALLRRHTSNHQASEMDAEVESTTESAFAYEALTPANNSVPGRARSWLQRAYWVPGVAVLLAVVLSFAYVRLAHVRPLGGESATGEPAMPTFPAVPVADELEAAPEPPPVTSDPPNAVSKTASSPDLTKAVVPLATTPLHHEPVDQDRQLGNEKRRNTRKAGAQSAAPSGHNLHTRHESESKTAPKADPFAEAHEGVFLASSGSMAAHLVYAPTPSYPRLASFTRVQGQVIMQVVVARDGSVAVTRVLGGPRLLRGAAERAIRHWRYRPYVVDGKTTDVATIVTVTFKLPH